MFSQIWEKTNLNSYLKLRNGQNKNHNTKMMYFILCQVSVKWLMYSHFERDHPSVRFSLSKTNRYPFMKFSAQIKMKLLTSLKGKHKLRYVLNHHKVQVPISCSDCWRHRVTILTLFLMNGPTWVGVRYRTGYIKKIIIISQGNRSWSLKVAQSLLSMQTTS